MDKHLAYYVVSYFGRLMNAQERAAYLHLTTTMKATGLRDDIVAQEEAKNSKIHSRWPQLILKYCGSRAAVIKLFLQTPRRILTEHRDQVFLNHCPQCGTLARTPEARQCRVCKHDWHD